VTFDEIVDAVMTRCNLQSDEAEDRVGVAVNQHYRRITSKLGMTTTRFVTRAVAMTVGVREVTFSSIEKIDRVIDVTTATAINPLFERSLHELRTLQPGSSAPTKWATKNVLGTSVVILTDTVPDEAYALQADGWTSLSDLETTDVPAFPASFHDILTFNVISEELLRKEKTDLSDRYHLMADKLFSDLQFHLADSPTYHTRQGDTDSSGFGSGASGGSATDEYARKLTNETILGFWTFGSTITLSNATPIIKTDTIDGTDTKHIEIVAGGDSGLDRGSRIILYGNEASPPGVAALQAGNVANSYVALSRGDGGHSITVDGTSGLVTLGYGQVKFPASQNASTNVNTLDDYEEGSWTPTITGSGGASGQTYSVQSGRYVKIGKHVTLWGRVTLSGLGTITTSAQIDGFPFTAHNVVNSGGSIGYFAAMTATFGSLSMLVQTATTKATLYGLKVPATGMTALVQADMSNTTDIIFTVTYEASA